jgi:hypothetical protein
MPDLVIRIKKNPDGSGALTAVRADGTVTWQRQKQTVGPFFALHDLTHYAVESVLGLERAFFGLLADGWNVTDFGTPWPRGQLPPEAATAELIVGFLDVERVTGDRGGAAEFAERMREYADQHRCEIHIRLTDDDLVRIRQRRAELFARWNTTPAGGTLELTFDRALNRQNATTH